MAEFYVWLRFGVRDEEAGRMLGISLNCFLALLALSTLLPQFPGLPASGQGALLCEVHLPLL